MKCQAHGKTRYEIAIKVNELTHLILNFEFVFKKAEPPQFPAQLEGREDGVLRGECYQRWTGQSPVSIDSTPRMPQRVLLSGCNAFFASAPGTITFLV